MGQKSQKFAWGWAHVVSPENRPVLGAKSLNMGALFLKNYS